MTNIAFLGLGAMGSRIEIGKAKQADASNNAGNGAYGQADSGDDLNHRDCLASSWARLPKRQNLQTAIVPMKLTRA